MAEVVEADADDEEEVPNEFECIICMKLLLDPVTVSCGHTFCRECLERSLGYRGFCALCNAPIVMGQNVNVLIRGIIQERYPKALGKRLREQEDELLDDEREAIEARRREAHSGAGGGETPAIEAGAGGAAAGATATATAAPVLPLIRGFGSLSSPLLPYCRAEVELVSWVEEAVAQYALQGARRVGILAADAGDDAARPMGVCLELEGVERSTQRPPRARLVGKYRFWVTEPPQLHEDGFELGRCEPFFDAHLSLADLRLVAAPEPPRPLPTEEVEEVQQPAEGTAAEAEAQALPVEGTAEVGRRVLELLEQQLQRVGQGGRRTFHAEFGEAPALRSGGQGVAVTSASLEQLSFWLLGALVTDRHTRRQWLGCVDTRARLEYCRTRLEAAGGRPVLNLPGASSWMHPGQSAFGSLAMLVAIVVVFLAKAAGVFDERRGSGYGEYGGGDTSQKMEETWNFMQLFR